MLVRIFFKEGNVGEDGRENKYRALEVILWRVKCGGIDVKIRG